MCYCQYKLNPALVFVSFLNVINIDKLCKKYIQILFSDGLTRYTCMTSALGAAGLFLDSSEEEGGLARSSMSGSLSCSTKQNTKILVSRIIHGFGNFRGCANPDESCDKEVYSDTMIAAHCDGKVSCFVQTFPKWLEKCSMISDFVHVEYECVFGKHYRIIYYNHTPKKVQSTET